MSVLLEIMERVVAQARGGEALEVFGIDDTTTSVRAFDGDVESFSSARTRGIGVRVVSDQRVGYAHTADLSEAALASTLEAARANAKVTTPDEGNVLPEPRAVHDVDGLWDPQAQEVPADRKVALALGVEAAVRSAGDPIKGVDAAIYGDSLTEAAILSTTGVRGSYRRSDAYLLVEALAEADGHTASSHGVAMARNPDSLDIEAAAHEAVSRASRLAGGRKPPSGKLAIVLDPSVTAALLGVLAGGLTAEAVQRGRSLFADKVGDSLAPGNVTLIDDGRLPEGFASAPWDGEGVPTAATTLIESGVLQGFLHYTASAVRAGTSSTGNADRGSHKSPPGLGPTNLYLEPGSSTPDALLATVDRGFYCQQVMGLHSGANPVTGDISVGASGLMIRDGALAEPVREATVAGTIPQLLANISGVGDDLRFFPQYDSAGGVTLVIAEMTLAGS